ncbi:uncharacterized protein BDR25DRAFT_302381 [Lindgomyces ingoldianus]|uniref:Uncharacterized protein n=1 Tax=Lindgomyces ingoldianus TaxID=673940 RepID=A0ACB6R5D4_9PLEO|nr:uncharacterized protein BDR25DRAFT_302381 [Lindgomyces ingoldianus]KAF2473512.1 hypothetical protein BDR25DRAFT_302381 [Lindgomyces ingoldianus]
MGPLILPDDPLPITLADLLSNTLVLRQTAPYLPVSAIYALAATSKAFHYIVHQSPEVFRYLDLSTVKSAVVPYEPLDSGGIRWRAERMDESLTEDEFYSGPLRGIFSKLERRCLLRNVHTMVLDGLSVPADLVREIIAEDKFNVRILSIRDARNLNERKLRQVLRFAVRPTRPEGTPRIKGIYLFGPREPAPIQDAPGKKKPPPMRSPPKGIIYSQGAQISAEWNQRSADALNAALARTEDKWYRCSGRMLAKRPSMEWAETLKACEGIIFFDAVLCRGPRHDPTKAFISEGPTTGLPNPASYLNPAIATVALGPSGCETCHSSPEGPAMYGQSPSSEFPLLSPLPLHSASIRAAQSPHTTDGSRPPPLFARCEECLKGRWCERCHKWWDEECYAGSAIAKRTELQQTEFIESVQTNGTSHIIPKQTIKIIGVRRDCFGCGHTCIGCKERYIRRCVSCQNEYCVEDNDASSATRCDWCNYTSRRTVEMY